MEKYIDDTKNALLKILTSRKKKLIVELWYQFEKGPIKTNRNS